MSAERKLQPQNAPAEDQSSLEPFALKQQVAERLAAHRNRKGQHTAANLDQPAATPARERTARIAAAVAERYAHSKSYRSFLAEEAERAIRQAEAAAEVAALNAQAVAQAQYDLLEELDQYVAEPPSVPALLPPPAGQRQAATQTRPAPAAQLDLPPAPQPAPLRVRLAEDIRRPEIDASTIHRSLRTSAREAVEDVADAVEPLDPEEVLSLDEEIAFRQDPVFDPIEPTVDIPANLIEFPRQLVAPRRARPRLAEGPLREDSEAPHDPSQLRIFEVEAEQISPAFATEAEAPEWTSILLDAQPREAVEDGLAHHEPMQQTYAEPHIAQYLHRATDARSLYSAPFQVAPLNLRVMSAAVDACAILAASMIFLAGLVLTASHFAPGGLHMGLPQAALTALITVV
ncbi:MAG: hypothetical protein JST61_09915, partial [Acidobacteria bacterium]|nr:hypothetical protein [Acidobacteriota bacterium]